MTENMREDGSFYVAEDLSDDLLAFEGSPVALLIETGKRGKVIWAERLGWRKLQGEDGRMTIALVGYGAHYREI